jgi:phage terminase large subunit
MRAYGATIRKARKPAGSVETGTKWLADLAKIYIDPSLCPLAAKEFVNYAFEQSRDGEVVSRYPDKDNHAIDATRYSLQDDITDPERPDSGISAAAFGF